MSKDASGLLLRATLRKKVKSNYFIVRPKVDQRAGLLSLPHLGHFRRTARSPHLPVLRKHSPEGDTGAQRYAPLVITYYSFTDPEGMEG